MNALLKNLGMALTIVLSVLAAACSSEGDEPTPPTPNERKDIVLSRSESKIVSAQNESSFNLYNALCGSSGDVSMFVSPLSAQMLLSIVANGTAGATQQGFLDFLGFKESDIDAVNTFNAKLMQELAAADNTVSLSLAHSIWLDNNSKARESFINDSKSLYNAEIFITEDLCSTETMDAINAWCSDKTKGVIPQYLYRVLFPGTNIAFFNATYFDGKWATPFDKNKTTKGNFRIDSGETVVVDMMNGDVMAGYLKQGDTEIVVLPYGNGAYEMALFIQESSEKPCPPNYFAKNNVRAINAKLESIPKRAIDLTMPKFTMPFRVPIDLEFLRSGTVNCDFSPMMEEQPRMAMFEQKSYITVDEDGTQAAAVTGHDYYILNMGTEPQEVLKVRIESPFDFLIRETSTGAILFMGRKNKFLN